MLKDETQQVTGAFKFRGCLKWVSENPASELMTASTGNHGLGLAEATRMYGRTVTVFLPKGTADPKLRGLADRGASIVELDLGYDDCVEVARCEARSAGCPYVPSYEDSDLIAGHGTLLDEVVSDLGYIPDVVVVPVGGGGLLASTLDRMSAACQVIGVEHQDFPALSDALRRGANVGLPATVRHWAEGLAVKRAGDLAFAAARRRALSIDLVDDADLQHAMRFLWNELGVRAEGAGAAATAVVRRGIGERRWPPGTTVLAVISGGNIDDARFTRMLARAA